VFSATAEPVAASRGEIYQYVGDEIVSLDRRRGKVKRGRSSASS